MLAHSFAGTFIALCAYYPCKDDCYALFRDCPMIFSSRDVTGSGPKSRCSCLVLQVATAVPQLAQQSSAAVKGLGAGLKRSHMETSERAQQWLGASKQSAHKQATVSQETLKVRITMLRPAHPPSQQNSATHCIVYCMPTGACHSVHNICASRKFPTASYTPICLS